MARGLFSPAQATQDGDFLIFCIKSIIFIPRSSPTACPETPGLLQPPAATTKKLLEAWGGRKPLHHLSSKVQSLAQACSNIQPPQEFGGVCLWV